MVRIIEASEGFMGTKEEVEAFFEQLAWEKEQKLAYWKEFWYDIKWDSFWERYPNGYPGNCLVQWGDYWYIDETIDPDPPKDKIDHIEELIRNLSL